MFKNIAAYGWMLIDGVILTIEIALLSFMVAILFGLIGAYGKLGRSRINRFIANCYTVIIRGIPEYVLLLVLYYQGAQLIRLIASLWSEPQGFIEINSFYCRLHHLGFCLRCLCNGSVPRRHFSDPQRAGGSCLCLRDEPLVDGPPDLVPQMWRFALPGLGNIWLILLKSTAIISLIGLEELTRKSRIAGGATRDPLLFFRSSSAIMYLLLTVVSTFIIKYLERKNNYELRKPGI